jgi:hypothetical protein
MTFAIAKDVFSEMLVVARAVAPLEACDEVLRAD